MAALCIVITIFFLINVPKSQHDTQESLKVAIYFSQIYAWTYEEEVNTYEDL